MASRARNRSAPEARRAEWKRIRTNLGLIGRASRITRADFKRHEELFFEGTIEGRPASEARSGGKAFDYALAIFRLWYHPEPETLDLDRVRAEFLQDGLLRSAHDRLSRSWRQVRFPASYPADYGIMGGREHLVMQLICPGVDYQETVTGRIGKPQQVCPTPKILRQTCVGDCRLELCRDARFYPHAPFQFMWEHLSHAVEHYPERTFKDDLNLTAEQQRHALKRLVAEILSFDERRDASRRRSSTVAFVERVTGLFESGAFSPAMDALWREASAEMAELRAESEGKEEFYASVESIARRFKWPESDQQARIEQWELV